MNRIFKIIYNRARDLYMVGSENLRTHAGKTGVAVAAIALCSSAFAADPFEYTGSRWYGMGYWQDTDQKYSSVNILLNTNEDDLAGIVLGSTRLDVTDKNSPSVVTVNGLSSPTVMRGISLFDDGSGSASISFAGNLDVHLDGKADSAYGIAFWDGRMSSPVMSLPASVRRFILFLSGLIMLSMTTGSSAPVSAPLSPIRKRMAMKDITPQAMPIHRVSICMPPGPTQTGLTPISSLLSTVTVKRFPRICLTDRKPKANITTGDLACRQKSAANSPGLVMTGHGLSNRRFSFPGITSMAILSIWITVCG